MVSGLLGVVRVGGLSRLGRQERRRRVQGFKPVAPCGGTRAELHAGALLEGGGGMGSGAGVGFEDFDEQGYEEVAVHAGEGVDGAQLEGMVLLRFAACGGGQERDLGFGAVPREGGIGEAADLGIRVGGQFAPFWQCARVACKVECVGVGVCGGGGGALEALFEDGGGGVAAHPPETVGDDEGAVGLGIRDVAKGVEQGRLEAGEKFGECIVEELAVRFGALPGHVEDPRDEVFFLDVLEGAPGGALFRGRAREAGEKEADVLGGLRGEVACACADFGIFRAGHVFEEFRRALAGAVRRGRRVQRGLGGEGAARHFEEFGDAIGGPAPDLGFPIGRGWGGAFPGAAGSGGAGVNGFGAFEGRRAESGDRQDRVLGQEE